jgi:Type IV secretory pathway, VirD4 components
MNNSNIEKILRLESVANKSKDDDYKKLIYSKIDLLKNKYKITELEIQKYKTEFLAIETKMKPNRKQQVIEKIMQQKIILELKLENFFGVEYSKHIIGNISITIGGYMLITYIINLIIKLFTNLFKSFTTIEQARSGLFFMASPIKIKFVPVIIDILIIISLAVVALLKVNIPINRWQKSAEEKKNLKGSSEWTDVESQEKFFEKVPLNNPESIEQAGIPVHYQNGYFYCVKDPINSVILGSTRSGKSQGFVLPLMYLLAGSKNKDNMIITDPKGELHRKTRSMLEQCGYKVLTIDLVKPSRGQKWKMINSLQELYYEYTDESIERAIAGIKNISTILYSAEGEKDPFWKNSAKELFNSSMLYFLEECYNYLTIEQKEHLKKFIIARDDNGYNEKLSEFREINKNRFTMKNYTGFMNEVTRINKLAKKIEYDVLIDKRQPDEQVVRLYATAYIADGKTKTSILSVFFAELAIFQEVSVQKFMEENQVDYKSFLGEQPIALFLLIPDYMKDRHKLATICVEQLYQQLVEHLALNNIEKLGRRLHFILDEVGNMPAFDDLGSRLTVCLGRNILYHLFLQDYAQLKKIYGEEEKDIIISNAGVKVYIQTTSLDSNKYFSELLGKKTVKVLNHNGHLSNPLLTNVNEGIEDRELLNAQEIEKLKQWQIVTKIQRMDPILGEVLPAYESDYLGKEYLFEKNNVQNSESDNLIFNEKDTLNVGEKIYTKKELEYLYQTNKITREKYNELRKNTQ